LAEIKKDELNRRIDELLVKNGELHNKGVNLRNDRDRLGTAISRIREILREALIANGVDFAAESVDGVMSTSEMASKLAEIANSLRCVLHVKRSDRIGDAEKAGAYLCRAEKSEQRVEELEKEVSALRSELDLSRGLVASLESRVAVLSGVRYTSAMTFGGDQIQNIQARLDAVERRLALRGWK
jgi:predicted nuclease with TOPRIM domain